ncbi:MAG: 2-isopropylmalate synthase, partial [Rhodobacteraceae bacterium]|nr:2-isopropylmalate synthase [Paracoccaceae bacterium]
MRRIPSAIALTVALTLSGLATAQDSKIVSKQDEIGGTYEGTFRGGLQHGTGTYRLPNGYEY